MVRRYHRCLSGFLVIGLLGFFVSYCGRSDAEPEATTPQVSIKKIEYPQLIEAIKEQRGKVIVVDIWATFCEPCKKELPHLIEMQEKYADQGLVCMSVCLPYGKDLTADQAKALKFLTEKKATFSNYFLEDGFTVGETKWGIGSVPVTFVFDREGRRAKKFISGDADHPYDMKDVENLVKELLPVKK